MVAASAGMAPDRTRDDARPAVPGEVVPRPVEEHRRAVARSDQGDEVQPEPGLPGESAAEPDPAGQLADGRSPTDGRHGPLVEVAERLGGSTFEQPADLAGDVP